MLCACPLWGGARLEGRDNGPPPHTHKESRHIENVQEAGCRIILGEGYISYDVACTKPLDLRRSQLCLKFAKSIPIEMELLEN